jgi:hypothetical protein
MLQKLISWFKKPTLPDNNYNRVRKSHELIVNSFGDTILYGACIQFAKTADNAGVVSADLKIQGECVCFDWGNVRVWVFSEFTILTWVRDGELILEKLEI